MPKQRFYEKHPTVNKAVQLLFYFPNEFQSVIANGLSAIAEKEFQAEARLKDVKSLGGEKVLAIHKSKHKKRPYDQNPVVHGAMNHLMILSEEERVFIAEQIVELVSYIQDYLKTCQTFQTTPTLNTVEAIANVYVQLGPAESGKFVKAIREEFARKVEKRPPPEAAAKIVEQIQSDFSDMRIRGEKKLG